MAVKVSDLTTESTPASTDILLIADPSTGLAKKITVSALKTYMDGLGGGVDTTAPTVVSATATAGQTVVIVFSESVTVTSSGWSFKQNGGAWAINSVSGSGATWTFNMSTSAISSDTLLYSYAASTGNTVDTSSNELANITDASVTNSISGTAPTVTSKIVSSPADDIVVVFSQSMSAVTTAGWSMKKNGVAWTLSSVSGSGDTWTFQMGSSAISTDTLLISYDSSTGATIGTSVELGSFTDSAVTNSVVGYLTSSATGSEMESYNSSKGWRKEAASSDAWATPSTAACQVVFNETLSSGEEVICMVGSAPAKAIYFILSNGGSPDASSNADIDYGIYSGESLAANARAVESAGLVGPSQAISAGDLLKIKYAGSTITYEISTNSGGSWTTFYTAGASASGSYTLRVHAYSISAGFDEIYKG